MARRQIVEIDETKCDGCGRCVPTCAEGAIRIVNGKAKLVADMYCDGLGACLGECPRGAIQIIEREASPFDEAAVHERQRAVAAPPIDVCTANEPRPTSGRPENGPNSLAGRIIIQANINKKQPGFTGCPGAAMHNLGLNVLPVAAAAEQTPTRATPDDASPALSQWPIQLRLVPPDAPFLRKADLFLVADCVPFACADFHGQLLRRRPIVIGCPKLDDGQAYVEKLADMLVRSEINSLTVVHMEVPCCTNLVRIAAEAMRIAGVKIPLHDVAISLRGEVSRPL